MSTAKTSVNSSYALKRLARYLLAEGRLLTWAIVVSVISSLAAAVGPRIIGWIIDHALAAQNHEKLVYAMSIFIPIECVRLLGTALHSYLFKILGQNVLLVIRKELFAHLLHLPASRLDQQKTGDLSSRLTNDLDALGALLSGGFLRVIEKSLFVVVVAISMLSLQPFIGGLCLLAILGFLLFGAFISSSLARAFSTMRNHLGLMNGFMTERLGNTISIHAYNRETAEIAASFALSQHQRDLCQRPSRLFGLLHATLTVIIGASVAALLLSAESLMQAGELSAGTLVALITSLAYIFWPLLIILNDWHIYIAGISAANRVFEALDWPAELTKSSPLPREWRPQGKITFKNVWFAYDNINWVIEDLSFELATGNTFALVGPTGAGKTTILGLLLGLYVPQKGTILVDDINIQEIPLNELRQALGLVQQDVFLFSGSVRDNITCWGAFAEKQSLLELDADFAIKEKGNNLSFGQKQALAFSRTVAKDPEIWLVDEATSNLDPSLDTALLNSLHQQAAGKTIVIIAHRLQAITGCRQILVLNHGRLVESGSHQELMMVNGLYARLYRSQVQDVSIG
jgi:ATP-binding cassette subfamily B multidrug efflux pump